MQVEEASPHPPPASGATAQWEAKCKESTPTHNSVPPVACREQHRQHPLHARQPPPHPPPTCDAKAKQRRGNYKHHHAMRRGLGCNLILNHIHCRNQSDTHNPKNPKSKPNRNEISEREAAHINGEGRSTKVASQIAPTTTQSTRKNTSPLPSTQHTTMKSTPPPRNGIKYAPLVGVHDGEERVRRSTTSHIALGAPGED